ncbi:MAG: carotenoid oxygenase family protein [Microthrixaceae bacterium]
MSDEVGPGATLTGNLFHGAGEGDWDLEVIEGRWPDDALGEVFIIGPDKREPGGHWFNQFGLLHRFSMEPTPGGTISARARAMGTRVARIQRRYPKLFRTVEFAQFSPFGVSNMANTNVQAMDGRLFVGYDAGRPIEVDPVTLEVITPVGSNGEWAQMAPGLLEPMCPVAAHPAPSWEERALYFVNYFPMPGAPTYLARWGLSGPVERWPLEGMGPFDSIHDIKATSNHLVFCDLPFKLEPDVMRGRGPRQLSNQDFTQLWIVAKEDLRRTPPGESVPVTEVRIPMPTGHLMVDVDDSDGILRVHTEHITLADLMITLSEGEVTHSGAVVSRDHEGLISLAQQPGCMGTYEIVAATGEVRSADTIWDDRFWGGVLSTYDHTDSAARDQVTQAWFAGTGFDPALVSQDWWDMYAHSDHQRMVPTDELPPEGRPGALASFDLASRKVSGVFEYEPGSFPSPPTFVPRRDRSGPNDGYVMVLVHTDGVASSGRRSKEIQIFDAQDIEGGPLARATADGFNPPLLLHSYWMAGRRGPRPSSYRVSGVRDLLGAVASFGRVARTFTAVGREISSQKKAGTLPLSGPGAMPL